MANGVMLVDGNSIGFAAQSGTKLHAAGKETQAIYGFLRTLQNLVKATPGFTPIVLWDGKTWRKDVFPPYKATRDDNPKVAAERLAYRSQRPEIGKGLIHLGVPQVVGQALEADDLAGIMTRGAIKAGREVLLITGDKDWLQLVDETVTWFDPRFDRRCRYEDFPEFTGYATTSAFLEGKALMGDAGDEIPGVGGIGEKGAAQLLLDYGSVARFIAQAPSVKKLPKKWREFAELPERQELFRRNMTLMSLREPPPPFVSTDRRIIKKGFDLTGFTAFCREHQFHSLLTVIDQWTAPFSAIN